eukprot:m51a1_g14027 putative dual specificity protein phosphatase 1 (396) ;mRNA; r:1120643-1122043
MEGQRNKHGIVFEIATGSTAGAHCPPALEQRLSRPHSAAAGESCQTAPSESPEQRRARLLAARRERAAQSREATLAGLALSLAARLAAAPDAPEEKRPKILDQLAEASAVDLYNELAMRGTAVAVVDVRSQSQWASGGRVRGAVPLRALVAEINGAAPADPRRPNVCDAPRTVFFYGSGSFTVDDFANIMDVLEKCWTSSASRFRQLTGGYEYWRLKYPFLCDGELEAPDNSRIAVPEYDYPSEVIEDFLYLGSLHSLCKTVFEDLGITHVCRVCLGELDREKFASTVTLNIPLEDLTVEDIAPYFSQAVEFITLAKNAGGKVLVHCAAGVSRSATIVTAYLMIDRRWDLKTALQYVAKRRPIVKPNGGFVRQLQELEKQLGLCPEQIQDTAKSC